MTATLSMNMYHIKLVPKYQSAIVVKCSSSHLLIAVVILGASNFGCNLLLARWKQLAYIMTIDWCRRAYVLVYSYNTQLLSSFHNHKVQILHVSIQYAKMNAICGKLRRPTKQGWICPWRGSLFPTFSYLRYLVHSCS